MCSSSEIPDVTIPSLAKSLWNMNHQTFGSFLMLHKTVWSGVHKSRSKGIFLYKIIAKHFDLLFMYDQWVAIGYPKPTIDPTL